MTKPTKLPRITPPTLSRAKVKGRGINITVKVAKLPRARVTTIGVCLPAKDRQHFVVLSTPSPKSARQRAKFENLSEGEKVERVAEAIFTFRNPTEPWKKWRKSAVGEGCIEYARVVIAVMEGRTL